MSHLKGLLCYEENPTFPLRKLALTASLFQTSWAFYVAVYLLSPSDVHQLFLHQVSRFFKAIKMVLFCLCFWDRSTYKTSECMYMGMVQKGYSWLALLAWLERHRVCEGKEQAGDHVFVTSELLQEFVSGIFKSKICLFLVYLFKKKMV